jgi:hypothetical protein
MKDTVDEQKARSICSCDNKCASININKFTGIEYQGRFFRDKRSKNKTIAQLATQMNQNSKITALILYLKSKANNCLANMVNGKLHKL